VEERQANADGGQGSGPAHYPADSEHNELGFEVYFTYVPSHVKDKGKKAATEGAKAIKVWEAKLEALHETHGEDLKLLILGNEVVDKLATLAQSNFTITYNRCVVTLLDGVVLLHFDGSLVERGLRQVSIEAKAEHKFCWQASGNSMGNT
jgi:hypothetical protein